jgi:ribonuclease D
MTDQTPTPELSETPQTDTDAAQTPPAPTYPILAVPADGIPPVVDTPEALARTRKALASGTGPVAIDTERAQGYRYTAKAYLIQLRRQGAGSHLIDPTAFENGHDRADFHELAHDLADADWILHAATQDLPCLAEVHLVPTHLFDSELAARLLNLPRVNLGALIETVVGVTLLKEHSAADWSRRPIPEDWLAYAALDVELLTDLREWLIDRLTEAGKLEWARQEFEYLVEHANDAPSARRDPWRRTSGLHAVRTPAAMAVVRELWLAREDLARELDRAPGRVLADRAISDLAMLLDTSKKPRLTRTELRSVRGFTNRLPSRYEARWLAALDRVAELPKSELPPRHLSPDGPPPPRAWERRWPASFERYYRVRAALNELAEAHDVPVENLLSPDHLRRLLWDSPDQIEEDAIEARLIELGARDWQRELAVPVIAQYW